MTNQAKRRAGFKLHRDAAKRVASAKRAIKAILDIANELTPEHLRSFLDLGLWKLTKAAAANKYSIRFQTVAAIAAGSNGKVEHDHVYQRKKLRAALVRNPEKMDEILEKATGCVVTAEEHRLLSRISRDHPEMDGWERYERAGLRDSVRACPKS